MIISLCGFMGTGKSTVGRNLANYTYAEYVDLDIYIEEKYKCSVKDFFSQFGESKFREAEYEALCEIIEKHGNYKDKNLVISLGGGTVVHEKSAQIIKNQTFCIYLYSSADLLIKRLIKNNSKRPLIQGKDNDNIEQAVKQLLDYRDPIYRNVSKRTINSDTLSIKELVEQISMIFG